MSGEDQEQIEQTNQTDEDVVNPWEVKAESLTGVDYDKLISELRW